MDLARGFLKDICEHPEDDAPLLASALSGSTTLDFTGNNLLGPEAAALRKKPAGGRLIIGR